MNRDETTELLRHAARRASRHAFFLAADLEEFRQRHEMQEAELAQFLQCSPQALPRLALCRRPDPESPAFHSEVQRIARALEVESTSLARLVREVSARRALQQSDLDSHNETGRGLLMAARDAERDDAPETHTGEDQDSQPEGEC